MVDVVLNHRAAIRISPNSSWWTDFEGPDWGTQCSCFTGRKLQNTDSEGAPRRMGHRQGRLEVPPRATSKGMPRELHLDYCCFTTALLCYCCFTTALFYCCFTTAFLTPSNISRYVQITAPAAQRTRAKTPAMLPTSITPTRAYRCSKAAAKQH
jgi:hypothetical protein